MGKALPPFRDDFIDVEALGGIVVLLAAIGALVWANLATDAYETFWNQSVDLGLGLVDLDLSRAHWVTDGLMTVFFFVVGLEIKREIVRGELRNPRTAALPVVAAIGGMVLPALLFWSINAGEATAKGWAIPMATDIAFAVGVLAILGARVARPLKLFLLTLAIVDDIGAILVIALFYSGGITFGWLAAAAGVVLLILAMQRLGVGTPWAYVVPALAIWLCVEQSGVHATIAGVALGLMTPARPFGGRAVIEGLERRLHPWSSFLVVPLFALANAGVVVDSETVRRAASSPVAIGVLVGLVVGKPVGITAATWLGARAGVGHLPVGVSWRQVFGVGAVAGIGFTVALFVNDLSFAGPTFDDAVLGILAASLVSGGLGAVILATNPSRPT
ncbi:MAG: Na+/H+ antiporter NhaA [Actinomycetota bacterium]